EAYKNIKCPYSRRKGTPTKNLNFSRHCLMSMFVTVLILWLFVLIILSGDVEINPGPNSVEGDADSSINSSSSSYQMLSNHLSIFHLNIQSLLPKLDLIKAEADAYDVLVFSESWLKPDIQDDTISIVIFCRLSERTGVNKRVGGGVVIYVRDTFLCKRRCDLELRGLEAVWVEIQVKSKLILVGGFYRPPNSNNNYNNLIEESIDKAFNTNIVDIFILGDFNYNLLHNNDNKMTEIIQEFNLKQLITEATHFTEHSSSLIDLVMVRNTTNVLTSGVADCFIPDQVRYHCPIIVLLKFLRQSIKTFKRRIWSYPLADFDRFRTVLLDSNLDNKVESISDIDETVLQLTEAISSAAEQSIPNKIVTIRPAEHPWITCHIKNLIRKRKRNFKKFKRTSNLLFRDRYKILRNRIVTEIRKSKKDYFDKLDGLLSTETTNSKLFWKTAKQVLNIGKSAFNIPTLIMHNEHAEDSSQKANMMNTYFASQTMVDDINKPLPNLLPLQHSFQQIEISIQDVKDALFNLNIYKASGPDLISPRLLKEGANILAAPLCTLFNRSLVGRYYPKLWKNANVTPIHKKDDESLPSNYRPISLLSQMGKIMERCVHKCLYNYAIGNGILSPLQSGFIRGDSTTYQLIHTYHSFCEAVDSGKEVRTVFCDISKAFDRVWHKGLLHKLSGIGCSDMVVQWFASYLSGRQQRVVINGQSSDWAPINAGVPQGSILGPLLFLIYINDIVKDIGSSIRLFADDTSLYIVVDSPQTAASLLNNDLTTINKWAESWLVTFNASKTVSMTVSRKHNRIQHPPLTMNNTVLTETDCHKHLGITLSSSCTWTGHINIITL
ncbi:MAG: reverse transcriptase family protein, partial [Candidatus Thiodiazotropha endolucinida]